MTKEPVSLTTTTKILRRLKTQDIEGESMKRQDINERTVMCALHQVGKSSVHTSSREN